MDNGEKVISIIHFISPHRFWYCRVDDEESYISVRDLENDLTKYLKVNYGHMVHGAEIGVGSQIAVRYLPRNGFIRARVEEIMQNQNNKTSYMVWAVDHGFAFETQAQFCRELPEQFAKKIDRVRCGGIQKVVPAALRYDFLEQKQVTELTNKWCKRACESLHKILSDAALIEFVEHFEYDDQYWGDMIIHNYQGKVQHASDYLVNQNVAIRSADKFKKDFLGTKGNTVPIWQTIDGDNNYQKNVFPPELHEFLRDEPKCDLNDTQFRSAKIKVTAWFNDAEKNKRANSIVTKNVETASSLYDDVDDSVSKVALQYHGPSGRACKNQAGAIIKAAPVPTLDDFGISDDKLGSSVSNDEAASHVSTNSRSNYLHMLKNNYFHGKSKSASSNFHAEMVAKQLELNNVQDTTSNLAEKPALSRHALTGKGDHNITQFSQQSADDLVSISSKLENIIFPRRSASTQVTSQNTSNALHSTERSESNVKQELSENFLRPKGEICTSTMNNDNAVTSIPLRPLKRPVLSELNSSDTLQMSLEPRQKNDNESTTSNLVYASSEGSSNAPTDVSGSGISLRAVRLKQISLRNAQAVKKRNEVLLESKPDALKSKSRSKDEQNINMLPAGFDLANLAKYNKKDHWHCKETTRNSTTLQDQDFRFTRANNDKHKSIEKKEVDSNNKKEKEKPSTINSILTSEAETIPPQIETIKCKDDTEDNLNSSDVDDYLDFDNENNDDGDSDENSSRASSIVSMYSAQSDMENVSSRIEFESPKIVTAGKVQQQNSTIANPSKDLLQNFIKSTSSNANQENCSTQKPLTKNLSANVNVELQPPPHLTGDKELRLNYIDHTVLAHSIIEVKAIERLNKILLARDVREGMQSCGINTVIRTQSYAWPHMLQGNSCFIVHPPESGKTWCYIPTLCTAVINCLEAKSVPSTNGPLAIVLVASSDRAIAVSNHCSRLLKNFNQRDAKTLCSYGVRELIQTKILLMEGCAILVATPPNFRRLLEDNQRKDPLFNWQRFRHIIVDDIDVLLTRCKDDITFALKSLIASAPKIENSKKLLPQFVVTSRLYSSVLQNLIPISNQPLLLFGDFLEAAIYGKAKICFELCSKTQKVQKIIDFIKEHPYRNESLMILCNRDEDVFEICEQLQSAGIDCLGCHSETSILERQQIHKWKLPANIHSKVLVCADSVLYECEIQNVQNVIHFSLAIKWTKMKFRFSVHKELYENLIKTNFSATKSNKKIATSLILLDEENNEELPKIVEFLKSHNQLKNISPDVVKLSKSIIIEREKERCKADNQFCSIFFEYGECDKLSCQKRHTLTEDDINTGGSENEPLIQKGDLLMHVLNVYSPTHYAVRLLEHRASSAAAWKCIRQSDKAGGFFNKFNYFYMDSENLRRHWPIRANDICVLERNGSFCRVRVLKVPELKTESIVRSIDVTITLMDDGGILTEKSDYLYVCHEQFKDFPAQSCNVRLLGLRPLDNETSWDADTTHYVKGILMNKLQKNETVCASISFSLVNTIVVRNLCVMKKQLTLKNFRVCTDLKRDLVDKNYALIDETAEQRIHNTIKDYGLERILNEPIANENEDKALKEVENRNVDLNVKDAKTEKIKPEMPTNISKQREPETGSIDDNLVDALSPICNRPKKSRSEFIKDLQNTKFKQSLERSSTIQNETQEEPLPKTCSVLELLHCIKRSNELEAEGYDLEADGMEHIRDYFYQSDQNCKLAIMREMENQKNANKWAIMGAPIPAPATAPLTDEDSLKVPSKEIIANPPPLLLESSSSSIESELEQTNDMNVPPLQNMHKRPQTRWYETNHLIILNISAPDIVDYYLEVEKTYLYFMATIDGVDQVLVLNFLGTVEPQYTSHELRGLNVIVRLVKSLFMIWPRLLKQQEKMPWLSYDLNMLNVDDMEKLLPQQLIDRYLQDQNYKPRSSEAIEEDWDDDDDNLQTFDPIGNNDDIHDPINAELF